MAVKQTFTSILIACFLVGVFAAVALERNEPQNFTSSTTPEPIPICIGNTPCGWAVYKDLSKDIEYFMRNKCECEEGKKCIRERDNISVSAFVYTCIKRERTSGHFS